MDVTDEAIPEDSPHVASPLSPRGAFEQAWAAHGATDHPEKLRLHVERRKKDAQQLSFREMVGESFVPESELTYVRHVGSGSFATVDICKYHPPGGEERLVAVKRLTSNAAVEVASFASEANILRKLKHKNIVQYIGVGSTSEDDIVKRHAKASCYLVQEFMNGGTLKQKVWKRASFHHHVYSSADALQWGKDIAEGLAYLHTANPVVLHRDLKAENILLSLPDSGGKSGDKSTPGAGLTAKICDFGLAVSLLEPSMGFRQDDTQEPPSGLGLNRIDSHFHAQMQGHVKGNAITAEHIAEASKDMDRRLSRISAAGPSFRADTGSPMAGAKSFSQASSRLARTMSRKSAVSTGLPEEHEAYNLTGRAGSYLSMAPEVTMCWPYNEKADCFSFGVILYEVFLGKTVAHVLSEQDPGDSIAHPEMFAYKVAGGYRLPIPEDWPKDLQQLIWECWAEEASRRPSMPAIVRRLDALLKDPSLSSYSSSSSCSDCCCVQ